MADREKTDAAEKTTSKGGGRKRATTANKCVATLETELANAKTAHTRLVDVSTRVEGDACKARIELRNSEIRLGEVEKEAKVASENLEKVQKQFIDSAKAAEKTLRQLVEVSSRA